MDSKPLTCLPKGSIVTVVANKVSNHFGVLSRRVLVRHQTNDVGTVTEGWASVQSSQGYVILSPLISMCYTNSRWGSTRPVIKQCGHAAHFRCVETHTLSLLHRGASEQTYDGRFAANIDDGEFLCPLCKQLCNILIPRDHPIQPGLTIGMEIDDPMATCLSSKGPGLLRDIFVTACTVNLTADERHLIANKALEQFGSRLYSAMNVPWERTTGTQRKHQLLWNSAIQKWDYEDDSTDGSVKNILRLFRQQLIAWAAVGHSAAALEASTRSVEQVLPFGVLSNTTDPWPDFDSNTNYSHPMLLELKRNLTGASGLLRLLCRDMADQLSTGDRDGKATFIGVCLANIFEGRCWVENVLSKGSFESHPGASRWSSLSALISAMPCHVARDGTIPQRCEARAIAATMWIVKGLGRELRKKGDVPAPVAIQQLPSVNRIEAGWGTFDPFTTTDINEFRPGIACAFLYLPLLSWDLNTLAAAAFSAVLACPTTQLPTATDILSLTQTLMAGRIIQAIVTPCGFDEVHEIESNERCWQPEEEELQASAIAKLVAHCREVVLSKSVNYDMRFMGNKVDASSSRLLTGVGAAILPFARALILLLRACTAAVNDRQTKSGMTRKRTHADDILDDLTARKQLMTIEDGFHIVRAMQGPTPIDLLDSSGSWWPLLNRWLVAAVELEMHHGSSGRSILVSGAAASSAAGVATGQQFLTTTSSRDKTRDGRERASHVGNTMENRVEFRNRSDDGEQRADMDVNFVEADQGVLLQMLDGGIIHVNDMEDENDDMLQDVDMVEAEELVDFPEQIMGVPTFAQPAVSSSLYGEDSSDDHSSSEGPQFSITNQVCSL